MGNTGRHLDTGWDLRAGGGVNFSLYFGVMLNLGYDHFGINSTALNAIGVLGGDMHHHRYQEFTQPAVAVTTGFDPFFGFFPVAFPAQQVLASYSVNKPGIDAGAGIAFGSKWHGKFFAEARYNRIFMRNSHTDFIPATFGFRW